MISTYGSAPSNMKKKLVNINIKWLLNEKIVRSKPTIFEPSTFLTLYYHILHTVSISNLSKKFIQWMLLLYIENIWDAI